MWDVCVHCMCALINWYWLWSLKLGLAFWSCALLAGPVWVGVCVCVRARGLSWHDLWPFTTPLHWPGRGSPVLFSQLMRWRTQVEWQAQSGWRGFQCVEGCWLCGGGLAPPTQEVHCVVVVGVWWNVIDVIECLLVLTRLCCTNDVVCGLPVGFQWSVEISWRMGLLEEHGVVGVFWPLPSSSPLSILNAHFRL